MDITLEDVESAIKVLAEFLKKQRDATRILRQLGVRDRGVNPMNFSMNDIMSLVFKEAKSRQEAKEGEPVEAEPVATEEDLKRMREIAEKRKKEGAR